ncbi:MmgE/PrpD family protein [Pandoraea sp.]|uniref:MmgE/PrpD family protein n=1 Tax=Pandoraea sp. TaxID=1883445 RepID=UPI001216424D|nr:MmgE/PrpD family protein [Pandoraea sp.]TAL53198.1 MAG: MmgE/PrpD family protein [Pandoraea sp.]TAM20594.1 MAG: MmgE/PrpD family protein [Pandoraea sp.]
MNAAATSSRAEATPQLPIAPQLAGFALGLQLDQVPAAVRERAKHLLLDAIGLAYASHDYDFAQVSLRAMQALGSGPATVIGHGRLLQPRDAMLMNGVLVHGLDFDDTHSRGVIHATASIFPCVLGSAERVAASGAQMLAAYIAGMEVATRVGAVAQGGFHQVGFHPTGVAGVFGCAVAAARLDGLNARQAAMAQGIALSMASGSLEFLQDGAWTKRIHPGWAAGAGMTAAVLAKQGFIGPQAPYEGRFGLYASYLGEMRAQADLSLATAGLGQQWQIEEVAIKPIPACHFTHAAADAAVALHNQLGTEGSASFAQSIAGIARVRVKVPQQVVKTVCEPVANKRRPANSYEAQFSIPYIVASGLLKGRFTLDELEPAALADAAVLALAGKVDYEIDPDSTFPRHYTGEVILEMNGGRQLSHREAINRGSADRPLTNHDISDKYFINAKRALPESRAAQIRETVLSLERLEAGALHALLAEPI